MYGEEMFRSMLKMKGGVLNSYKKEWLSEHLFDTMFAKMYDTITRKEWNDLKWVISKEPSFCPDS